MHIVMRLVAVAVVSAGLGACGLSPMSTFAAYPVYGNPVNPTPARGYRVLCQTVPGVTNALFDDYQTGCVQAIAPTGDVVVVRARG